MAEADDASTPKFSRPERVLDCAARLEALYQITRDEDAGDPDEGQALAEAWCEAQVDAIADLTAAHASTPAKLAVRVEWMARLIDEYVGSCMGELLQDLMAAAVRDARALAAGAC